MVRLPKLQNGLLFFCSSREEVIEKFYPNIDFYYERGVCLFYYTKGRGGIRMMANLGRINS